MRKYLFFILIILLSCQEEITLDLPKAEEKLVVEGAIEPGFPPYVILTKNGGYFDPISDNPLLDIMVNDAESVKVWCYDDYNVRKERILEKVQGFDSISIYTVTDYEIDPYQQIPVPYTFSKAGRTYYLEIQWNNQIITAETTIPEPTPLDCLWVEQNESAEEDFKCDIRAIYSDPADQQNNILIRSKRIEHYKRKGEHSDSIQCEIINKPDPRLKLVDAGADVLINGESFETYFPRPNDKGFPTGKYNSTHTKDCNDSVVEFKNDVVLIKFCQIDESSMKFWRGLVRQEGTNGNPFAEPMNLVSNINNGLGIWAGYGAVYYRVEIIKDNVVSEEYTTDEGLTIIDIF
jgi:hypothetical protein